MKNKNGRPRRNKATCVEDRLSKLPNDLLLNILERLDTPDAIRTCILSKQMLNLPTMLSHFFINVGSILCHNNKDGHTKGRSIQINRAVIQITDNFLNSRSPEIKVRKLNIRFFLRHNDCLSIGKSVARAMAAQKVDTAEFEIITEKAWHISTPADFLHYAKQFNDFLAACPDAFAGLRRLCLRNMRFGELDIPNILGTCKRLESLHLTHCDSGIHSVLQVEHAQLVELEIDEGEFERIELTYLPKLQRVSYNNWDFYECPMRFSFVPQLSKLTLSQAGIKSDNILVLSQLLANVPSIIDLHLDFESEKIWVLPECPERLTPVLSKLQHVNLDNLPEGCDLSWTMFILEAAPSLKELCITVWDHWCNMETDTEYRMANGYCEKKEDVKWKPSASDFKHKNLVKLRIYGFQPDDNFVRYVRHVLEVAVNMKEISLHDRKVCGRCAHLDPEVKVCPSIYPRTAEERKQTTERLGLASATVIHFLS